MIRPLAILALSVALAGCDGTPEQHNAAGTPAQPRHGGVLRVAFDGDPNCIDPQQAGNNTALNVGRQLVDSLTDQDPQSAEIVPWLAERWDISDDSRQFTFHLREGVTFSDGSVLDAAAVKANFEAIVALGALAQLAGTYLAGLESVQVTGPLSVRITFKQANAQFLQATSTMSLGLLAPATLARSAEERCQGALVGSGPFTVDSFTHNKQVRLQARGDYAWPSSLAGHQGRAWLDAIEFHILPESGVRLGSLLSGQIEVNTSVPVQDEAVLDAQGLPAINRPNPGIVFNLTPNVSRPPLDELAVRQALNKAIDRQQLQGVISRYQKPASSVLASSTPYYQDQSAHLAYDPQGAAGLLDQAGWRTGADGWRQRDGKRLSLTLDYWQATTPVLELVQQQLRQAGIELRLNKSTIGQVILQQTSLDYGLWFFNLTRADPDVLRTVFLSTGRNVNVRGPAALDQVLVDSAASLDGQKRGALIARASAELLDQGYVIPLVEAATVTAMRDVVRGLHYEASTRLQFYDTWLAQPGSP
ncbi:ABC transporter substrate-binding protein [Pseudomonas japonica]|uniref:Peptide/nickel transport system substrate-binding protein n=1 Tax=Pseudomonas japonica TaxID=256466 RepID=A0A239L2F8_9PSED|nr:ABC transporter substrate-binding protein [Pseudomonas japonica]SNT24505.1 peptide/nickel transport system substrate-binding protein [Pseudomonas japonica]